MCKSWSIKYSCEHTCLFRLSTCRGTFTTRSRPDKEPKVACSTSPTLVFSSPSKCGACERTCVEEAMAKKIDSIRSRVALKSRARFEDEPDFEESLLPADNAELVAALAEQDKMHVYVHISYPDVRFKKFRVPEKGGRMTSKQVSRLSNEVFADDIEIVDDIEEWGASDEAVADYYDWSWNFSSDRFAEIAQECQQWMEGIDEHAEDDVMAWPLETDEKGQMTPLPGLTNTITEAAKPAEVGPQVQSIDFNVKEPQPSSIAPDIGTVLASASEKQHTNTTLVNSNTEINHHGKENIPPALTHFAPSSNQAFNKENAIPTIPYKSKSVPPHLRRRKSFIFNRQSSLMEHANGKTEADLVERMRCFNYNWVAVST